MLRGAAAMLVFLSHLRAFTFVDYGSLLDPSLVTKAFYAMTGLGHQAVIAFFALSGFLVGGKALSDMLAGCWSWRLYIPRRLTRLWVVVIPALAITLVLDRLGLMSSGGAGYGGAYYATYCSGPNPDLPLDHSLAALLGNLVFVQTIYVPVFGSNSPMWSLANEFWYYAVFPLAASLFLVPYGRSGLLLAAGLLMAAVLALPAGFLPGGLIWAAGAAGGWLVRSPRLAPLFRHAASRAAVAVLAGLAVVYTKIPGGAAPDLVLGLSLAAGLPALAHLPSWGAFYRRLARGAAGMSYTLYLVHFPLLTFVFLTGAAPVQWQPGLAGAGIFLAAAALTLAWTAGIWWCFERNTEGLFGAVAAFGRGRGM